MPVGPLARTVCIDAGLTRNQPGTRAGTGSSNPPEQQGAVGAAEAERVGNGDVDPAVARRVGHEVEVAAFAGTRPRIAGDDDAARIRELVAHPKERAEHVMLLDLERNDLGRICVPGSISVDERMVVESFAHVHHIVSNVRGTLRAEVMPGQAIAAVFPGGTITGCPKVRCMEIIAELEATPRGVYTGALGYLNHSGDGDLNILIRTLQQESGAIAFRAGAGIVVDSNAGAELDETRAKARGLLRALGVPS